MTKEKPKKRRQRQSPSDKQRPEGEISLEEIKSLQETSEQAYEESDLIPTGSIMQNLACSDFATGGYKLGSINTLGGVSDSGKTVLSLRMLAGCATDKRLDKFKLVPNNPEVKGSFNIPKLYPPLVGRLVEPPGGHSATIHQWGGSMVELCKSGEPFISCLDSLDALKADADFEKSTKKALEAAKGNVQAIKDIKASYNAEKAKTIKKILGEINDAMGNSDSVLLIVQQLNQKMNATKFEEPYTAAGGNAPMYFSTHRFWLVPGGKKITRTISGKKIEVGTPTIARCKKNHLNGKKRDIEFPIYDEYGLDDIESVCLFLSQFRWKNTSDSNSITPSVKISATEFFDKQIAFKDLVASMWDDPVKNTLKLRDIAQETWREREIALHTGRKAVFI